MRVGDDVLKNIKNIIHIPRFIKRNKLKVSIGILSIITLILITLCVVPGNNVVKTMGKKFLEGLGIYTEEIKSVNIDSNNFDDPGEWRIEKSARWISTDEAELTIKLNSVLKTGDNYKDVIFVLDISGSMIGDKIDRAISDAKELSEYVLSDSHNRVALITFDTNSTILSPFTNNKNDIIAALSTIQVTGCTNYNAGLLNVDSVMNGYTKQSNRDVVTLFLTDGYPNEDIPNQIGTYEMLKDKYPYMTINGVQYEMGLDIIDEIKEITDNQWVANQETLNNVLFDAAVTPTSYENFVITDYIDNDYFTVESVDNIKTSIGTVNLESESGTPKITWDLGNYQFLTGGNATLKMKLKLKQQYVESEGFYPTSKNIIVNYKVKDDSAKTKSSTQTPVLKNSYQVIYDTNTPEGCSLPSVASETHYIYQNVAKKSNNLSCEGYLFKGWEIDEDDSIDIKNVNDDVFVMPVHDVTIRGTWTRQAITKTMDGTVHEKTTLYKVLKNEAADGTYAKEYTGEHQDSMDASKSTQKIYHYYASNNTVANTIRDKNNVIFANHCWQMYRTTDTGGVKMIYNGDVVDNKCLDTRGNHVGYSAVNYQSLSSNYWYGTDYEYDSTTGEFSLTGTKEQATWNDSTFTELIGKYTCKSTGEFDSCSTLYLVDHYYSSSSAYLIPISADTQYSQIGKMSYFEDITYDISYAGYMHNDLYKSQENRIEKRTTFANKSKINDDYLYSDALTPWNGSFAKLVDAQRIGDLNDYQDLVGKYIQGSSSINSSSNYFYYVIAVEDNYFYYISESVNGRKIHTYTIGNSFISNQDGTYTIDNALTFNSYNYLDYKQYITEGTYLCVDPDNDKCNDLNYIFDVRYLDSSCLVYSILVNNEYKFGERFVYEDGVYKLAGNTFYLWNAADSDALYELRNAHYTCWNKSGECTNISYLISANVRAHEYITLDNGKDILDVLNIISSNNEKDSQVKNGVESWYKHDMLDYDEYLEDTIFCSDRTIYQYGMFNANGGVISGNIQPEFLYNNYYNNSNQNLYCTKNSDRFSTLNQNALLKYKIGLMTVSEVRLLNNANIVWGGSNFWSMSPDGLNSYMVRNNVIFGNSDYRKFYGADVRGEYGVRPAISLRPGIEYTDGDGSMEHPYIVDTN